MILRLALRSLAVRPWRTAVLAAGFGLGIAVMAALLGVGEVIIEQAHAPALRGGGDLVVAGAAGPIDSARFVLDNVLGAPGIRERRVAASPSRKALLYLVRDGASWPVHVRGGVPSLERAVGDPEVTAVPAWTDEPRDASWSHPGPEDVLRAIDRFHAAANDAGSQHAFSRSSWAEWLYFNGRTPDGRLRFYLTFLAAAPSPDGRVPIIVRLQLDRDGRSTNYSAGTAVEAAELLARAPDLDVANNQVRLHGSTYRIKLALRPERGEGALSGDVVLDAAPRHSLPPAAIRGAHGWVSGYVVPVLTGALHGTLRVGGETISLEGATGYHDHNWGFWEGVRWQWGQVANQDLSIVFGRVFPPETVADPARVPGFLAVVGPDGPIAFATDVAIAERTTGDTPTAIDVTARNPRVNLHLTLTVEESVGTRMALTASDGRVMRFLQLGGTYRVSGRAGDRALDFTTRGSAETFR
jgi:hypothetical protein